MGYMELVKSYSNQMRVVEAPASGGGLSQNGKFSYGYASSAGKRSSMEDFFETRIDTVDGIDGEIVGLFGVFDGHGGAKAAEYVKRHLFSNLITHPKFISDTRSAITDAYNHTDSELLKSDTKDAGSTASTAILVGDRLLVANVGDSRAVICRSGNAFAVSRDHKPDQSDERERIENAGGFVMWAGTWRVGGVLAVSRAFGDRLLKQYVVADPEIQEEKIDDSLEFLILASDGLWDVFSNEEAVAVVKEVEDPEESSKKLVGEAIRRGSADNITCVVVRFLESKTTDNISSTHASSSKEPNQGPTAVRNDADHKTAAKETNQDHESVHSDVDRNTENENLNQKPIAARRDNSGHIRSTPAEHSVSSELSGSAVEKNQMPIAVSSSSAKQPGQGQLTVHNNLDHKISAKETKQDNTAVHSHMDRNAKKDNLNQKPIAARSNNSDYPSSTQKPNATSAVESSISSEQSRSAVEKKQMPADCSVSEPKTSAKETNQDHTAVHRGLDCNGENDKLNQKLITARGVSSSHISSTQKPIANTAAERSLSSEQRCSVGEKNQMPIASHTGSEPRSSAKVSDQRQNTVNDDLDRSIEKQKQKIAATRSLSLEKKCPAGEKDQMPSEPKSYSKVPNDRQITVENDLDCTIVNQKQMLAATLAASSEHSGSTDEKKRKPTTGHSESTTIKASNLPFNYNAH